MAYTSFAWGSLVLAPAVLLAACSGNPETRQSGETGDSEAAEAYAAVGVNYSPGAVGIGDPYFPLDGNGGYDVEHYDLDVRYEPATRELSGVATITAKATQNLSSFNLDLTGLEVDSIEVDRRPATWTRAEGELSVVPSRGLRKKARFSVVVRYHGIPESIWSMDSQTGFIHTPEGAIVIGEPHVAATWFPVNDHPSDKASYTFRVTVPEDLEVVANGVLKSRRSRAGFTTWTWDAADPMASYLAGMAIGHYDIRDYRRRGIRYWDAVASSLNVDSPAMLPVSGSKLLYSGVRNPIEVTTAGYRRLTRVINVPAGGAELAFKVNRDTLPVDAVIVEARSAGGNDWTTLPDQNGHTSQELSECNFLLYSAPFVEHYMTEDWEIEPPCLPTGTTGEWHAAAGVSSGWEDWRIELERSGPIEVSITYLVGAQNSVRRGVAIDDITVSTGEGTTSFEGAIDPLNGWVAPSTGPEGSPDNVVTWALSGSIARVPAIADAVRSSLDRQSEMIDFGSQVFGPYPFSVAGATVVVTDAFFAALENQTRPIYVSGFWGDEPPGRVYYDVIMHELAHQWFGNSLTIEAWQHIWLNEGFAKYAEWLWSEKEGLATAQEFYDIYIDLPPGLWLWSLTIGDPGPDDLFSSAVYYRGALTLHALRLKVGDSTFFKILRAWTKTQAGGTVTTEEFITLAEQLARRNLRSFFDAWLFTATKPDLTAAPRGYGVVTPRALRQIQRELPQGAGTFDRSRFSSRALRGPVATSVKAGLP